MKKLLLFFLSILLLSACEKKVDLSDYQSLKEQVRQIKKEISNNENKYEQLKREYDNALKKKEYLVSCKKVACERADNLYYESLHFITGRTLLSLSDLIDDANDIKKALDGQTVFYRRRIRNGIEY